MAGFKYGLQQEEAFNLYAKPEIRVLVRLLDAFSTFIGRDEITITDAIREPREGKPSCHPNGEAIDVRTRENGKGWSWSIQRLLDMLKDYDGRLSYLWEDIDGENEHLHVQIKISEPI
jgi:hypothetical protein